MPPLKQVVITVHGVNHDPAWQPMVARVVEPHFRAVKIEYPDYRTIRGPLKAVINLWLGGLVAAALGLAALFLLAGRWGGGLRAGLSALAIFGLALWVAYFQRQGCASRVKRELVAASAGDPLAPHVVAHSLGTYLVGTALRKYPDVRFDRVVLVGCVLPRGYKWSKVFAGKPRAFTHVRNETGERDPVVKCVGLVEPLVRDMGDAGVHGFDGDEGVVHEEAGPWGPCEECVATGEPALVHNVPLLEFLHSDHFLGPGHARDLWLPYLWGYTPIEFLDYLVRCRDAAYLRQERRRTDLKLVEHKLRERRYTWTKGLTLEACLALEIEAYRNHPTVAAAARALSVAELVDDAIEFLYLRVIEASMESVKLGPRDDEVIRGLDPLRAITTATELALGVHA